MTKRLLLLGLVFLLIGSAAAVAWRCARKHCSKKRSAAVSMTCPKKAECAPAATEKKIDVQFESKNLLEILNFLAEHGLDFIYSEPSLLKDVSVTVKLTQVTVTEAASAILKLTGLKFELTPEKIFIVLGR